jgi:hypothetical protein
MPAFTDQDALGAIEAIGGITRIITSTHHSKPAVVGGGVPIATTMTVLGPFFVYGYNMLSAKTSAGLRIFSSRQAIQIRNLDSLLAAALT